jgi:excisionase family DNA binding protein
MALRTIAEIAEKTRLARSTLYKMTAQRAIPFVKLGARVLFEDSAVDAWLAAHRMPPISELSNRDE